MATVQALSFAPTSISGCSLWLDAADSSTFTFSGGNITGWRDKSGLGNNGTATGVPTISTAAYQGRQSIFLNGTSFFQGPISITGTQITSFAVVQFNAVYEMRVISLATTSNQDWDSGLRCTPITIIGEASFLNRIGQFRNPAINGYGPVTSSNTPYFLTSMFTGTNSLFYTNGTVGTTNSNITGSFSISAYGVGSTANNAGGNLLGYMGEVLIYTASLTTAQRQQVEGYLAWKWGLQANLPTSHPYYYIAPNSQGLGIPPGLRLAAPTRSFQSSTSPFSFFNPRNIPGLVLWLDGSDLTTMFQNSAATTPVTTTGQPVWVWRDKSALAANINFGNANITLSNNGPYFPSNQGATNLSYTVGSCFGVAAYATSSYGSNFPGLIGFNGGGNMMYGYLTTTMGSALIGGATYWANGTVNGSVAGTANANQMWSVTTLSPPAYSGLRVGYGDLVTGSNGAWLGTISEILLYSVTLTTAQRQQVEGYLAWKWSIAGNLPSNHPFKNGQPGLSMPVPVLNSRNFTQSSFSPARVSGNVLWLDGQDPLATGTLPSNGTSIPTWLDKSGSGNNATSGSSTLIRSAINGYSAISFNGTSTSYVTQDLYSNRSFSIFVVMRRQAAIVSYNAILGGSGNTTNTNLQIIFPNDTNLTLGFWGNDLGSSFPSYTGNASTEPAYLLGFTYTPGARIIWRNGTLMNQDGNSANITSFAGARIGYISALSNLNPWFNGYIGEMISLNGTPVTSQRQSIEGYLAWKWGLQGNLPATHPFSKFPPPPN